jgi:molybdopterin molybdotransferase
MSQPRRLLDDCFLNDRDRLRHADALKLLDERLKPVAGTEEVALAEALGRVLAEDVVAPRPIPAFTNSAVDGYAFAHRSLGAGPTRLRLAGRAAAGHAPPARSRPARRPGSSPVPSCPKAPTAASCRRTWRSRATFVIVPPGLKAGRQHPQGRRGPSGRRAVAARAGTRLRPQELAAIASTGRDRIRCYRRFAWRCLDRRRDRAPRRATGPRPGL